MKLSFIEKKSNTAFVNNNTVVPIDPMSFTLQIFSLLAILNQCSELLLNSSSVYRVFLWRSAQF